MRGLGRFMEHFWLALTIACAGLAGYVWWRFGALEARAWLVLPAIACAAWLFRRFARRRQQAWEERQRRSG